MCLIYHRGWDIRSPTQKKIKFFFRLTGGGSARGAPRGDCQELKVFEEKGFRFYSGLLHCQALNLSHSVATLRCADLIQGRCRDYQPPREAIRYESAHCVSRRCSSRKRRSRPERSKQTSQPLPSRGEPTTWPLSPLGVSTSMPNAMVVIVKLFAGRHQFAEAALDVYSTLLHFGLFVFLAHCSNTITHKGLFVKG